MDWLHRPPVEPNWTKWLHSLAATVPVTYLLRDEFTDTRAAGSVNGTAATPGPGSRVVTDTGNNISVGIGVLDFSGGTGVWGQTAYALNTAFTRPGGYVSGKVLEFDIVADTDKDIWVGLCTDTAPGSYLAANCEHGLLFANDGNLDVVAGGVLVKTNAVTLVNGTTYRVRFIVYSTGCFYSISGGAFGALGTYAALYEDIVESTATLYAAISNLDAITTIDNVTTPTLINLDQAVTFADYVTDVPLADAQSLRNLFRLTTGNAWTDKTNWLSMVTCASWFGITLTGGRVTRIDIDGNNLNGDVSSWAMPTVIKILYLYSNINVSGDISGWILPAAMTDFALYNTSVSGDISGWILPAAQVTFDIYNTSVSGDISGWILPATLITFRIYNTSVSGDISGWILPASLRTFYIYATSLSNAPVFSSAVNLRDFRNASCGLSQAHVDAVCLGIYNRRASFTWATPSANIGGTNSTPSGIYQDGDPPTTGKEYIFELVNDPEAEGFNTWTWTYTP